LSSADQYLDQLYENAPLQYRFAAKSEEEWSEWRQRLKTVFTELLGGFPEKAPDLNAKVIEETDCGDYIRQRVEYTSSAPFVFPAYILIPKHAQGKLPAVIACHGHGYGSKDLVGLNPDGSPKQGDPGYQKNFAIELVKRGFLVAAPELLGFGDMRLRENTGQDPNQNSCYRIATNLLMAGKTLAGQRIDQIRRTIDYLATRPDADTDRIGVMGISGGGLVCSYAAAVDERLKAVVVSGYTNTFQKSILSIHHCIDNFIPGILNYAEMPDLISLIAPRPLMIESGTKDHIFPIEATREALGKIGQVYALLNARDRLDSDIFEGTHEISGKKAYDWFLRWL